MDVVFAGYDWIPVFLLRVGGRTSKLLPVLDDLDSATGGGLNWVEMM